MERYIRRSNLIRAFGFGVLAVALVSAATLARSAPTPQDSNTLSIKTKALPDGQVGKIYVRVIQATGGKPPWNFSVKGQPAGLSFDTVRGPNTTDHLQGTPTEAGDFDVQFTVTDSADPPQSSTTTLKLHISP